MAFSLSRNARLFVSTSATVAGILDTNTWEIPVLDGFSFTATTGTQEIEISEAGTTPTRGQQVFTTALEPVEWSIQSYMRPRWDVPDGITDAVERILWEALAAPPASTIGTAADGGGSGATTRQNGAAGGMTVSFSNSNTNELKQLSMLFNLGTTAAPVWYHITGAVVNTAEVDFAIDAIASISWSGFGTSVQEVTDSADQATLDSMLANGGDLQDTSFPTTTVGYLAPPTGAQACIRNKLSTVTLTGTSGQTGIGGNTYTVVLTGGSLSITNNITYLTPEALGVVNEPCGHFTGQRQISGNMTAYLKTGGAGDTGQLINDLLTYSRAAGGADPTRFDLDIYVGGPAPGAPWDTPIVQFSLPDAHLVIPTINVEDVVSVDIPFIGLPYSGGAPDPSAANEISVAYFADET